MQRYFPMILMLCGAGALTLFAASMAIWSGIDHYRQNRIYQPTTAIIKSRRLERSGGESPIWLVALDVEFDVGGRTQQAIVQIEDELPNGANTPTSWFDEHYPKETEIDIYFDPDAPEIAIHEPDPVPIWHITLFFSACGFGMFCIVIALTRRDDQIAYAADYLKQDDEQTASAHAWKPAASRGRALLLLLLAVLVWFAVAAFSLSQYLAFVGRRLDPFWFCMFVIYCFVGVVLATILIGLWVTAAPLRGPVIRTPSDRLWLGNSNQVEFVAEVTRRFVVRELRLRLGWMGYGATDPQAEDESTVTWVGDENSGRGVVALKDVAVARGERLIACAEFKIPDDAPESTPLEERSGGRIAWMIEARLSHGLLGNQRYLFPVLVRRAERAEPIA